LTLPALINYFQDASTFQSESLGRGLLYLKEKKLVWVLSSWQIVVERFPTLGEPVTIGTLPYDMKGFLGYRNFAMLDANGAYIAKAATLWSLLSTETFRPVAVPEDILAAYKLEEKLPMTYAPRKVAIPEGGEFLEPVVVRKQHLDTNYHVNNGQFVSIAMEYLPEHFCIAQMRAEYKKQAFLNDVLVPYKVQTEGKVVIALEDETGAPYVIVEFEEKKPEGQEE
jgi:acyl-ACP thioesterase